MKKLILASGSPRKKEIFEKLGIPFDVQSSDCNEDYKESMAPGEIVKKLSLDKAKNVADKNKDSVVIGADQIIYFEGKVIGKPKDEKDAIETLKRFSSSSHSVFNGYTVIDADSGKTVSKFTETKVYFKKLSDKDIEGYVNTGEPLGKAGSYAVQGLGAILVDKIEGDYYSVMGLPLSSIAETLKSFGISTLKLRVP